MFKKNSLNFTLAFAALSFFISCTSSKPVKAPKEENPSAANLPKTEDIIFQDTTKGSSSSASSVSINEVPETQNTVRTASVWIDAIGADAFLALGFMQELEKHVDIVSVDGVGFGCWTAISWATENRGSYAEWQAFKWDSWDVLGSNILNRVIGRSNADSFRDRLEGRLPLKSKDHYKIPMSCPYLYAKQTAFQGATDLAVNEELWIQMRNTFFFPLADIEKDQRRSGFFRGPVQPDEFLKFTPANTKPEDHVWIVLSSEAVRKELRRDPQPDLQRGIIDNVRWVRKVIAPGEYPLVSQAKDLKKRRAMLLRGRKDAKQFFENPAVSSFLGFGSNL